MSEAKRSRLSIWWQASRAFSFTASVIPVTVGAAVAVAEGRQVLWWLFPFVVVSSVLLHAATNMTNDYFDFVNGVDKSDTKGSSGVLTSGLLQPEELKKGAYLLFFLASLLGSVIIWARGWQILALGLVGLCGGYFYTAAPLAYKYLALGDLFVFVLMGPLMVIGSNFALTGIWSMRALFLSAPIGSLVAGILCANNYRDREADKSSSAKTMANVLPPKLARMEYYGLLLGAYIVVGILVLTGHSSVATLAVFLTLPMAITNILLLAKDPEGKGESIASLDVRTAQLHMAFGVLLVISLVVGA